MENQEAINEISKKICQDFSPDFEQFLIDFYKDIENRTKDFESEDCFRIHIQVMMTLFALELSKIFAPLSRDIVQEACDTMTDKIKATSLIFNKQFLEYAHDLHKNSDTGNSCC